MKLSRTNSPARSEPYNLLLYYIRERRAIYERRKLGAPKPWTQDKILQQYRFCNVEREHDTVTQWISRHWREPQAEHPDLWFAMVMARLVNWPDTLWEIEYPLLQENFSLDSFVSVIHERQRSGEKAYSGAYIVSTNGNKMDKAEYLARWVLKPLWENRWYIRPLYSDTLSSFAGRLNQYDGMGTFLTGQVVADTKYASPQLRNAVDWYSWAYSGPGSRRGLNRLLGRPKDNPWKEIVWHDELLMLQAMLKADGVDLHAQDVQNNLCEYDKYVRVLHGEGRPRSTYPGV